MLKTIYGPESVKTSEETLPTRRTGVRWDALRYLRAQSVEQSARTQMCPQRLC